MGREGREEGQAFLRARGRWGKESAETKRKAQESQSCCTRGQILVHTEQGLVHFCVR